MLCSISISEIRLVQGEKNKTQEGQSRGCGYRLGKRQSRLEFRSNSREEEKEDGGKDNTYIRIRALTIGW